jgi:thioredoxin-dependent peroxiredoxin
MRRVATWTLLCMVLATMAWAQDLPGKKSDTAPGVPTPSDASLQEPEGDLPNAEAAAVGAGAPEFVLDSASGGQVRLSRLKGRWAVLVFEHDGRRLAALQGIVADVGKLGASLYGVSSDGTGALKELATRSKLTFPLLSDPTGEVAQLYGMYDDAANAPLPGLALLDPQGVVRALWSGPSLHPDEVLQLVRHSIAGA